MAVAASFGLAREARADPLFPSLTLDRLQATRLRPLFSPTRRPPPPPPVVVAAPAPPPPPTPPPQVALVGVVIGGKLPLVMLKHPADSRPTTFAIGDAVDGWDIVAVSRRHITLAHEGRTIDIDMSDAPK